MRSHFFLALLSLPVLASAQVSPSTSLPASGAASGTVEGARNRTTQVVPNGYISQGEKTYVLRDGRVFQLKEAISLQIRPNGTLVNFDGEETVIPAGMMLTSDGRIVEAPDLPTLSDDSSAVTYSMDRSTDSETKPMAADSIEEKQPLADEDSDLNTGVGPQGSQENIDNDNLNSETTATSGVGQDGLSGGTTSTDVPD